MFKTVLGVQLTRTECHAVRLRRGWRGTTVEGVLRVARGEGGDRPWCEGLGPWNMAIAAAPSDEVFHRDVHLPFSDLKKLEQAAPLEAEESLPLPLEEVVCGVHPVARGPQGSDVLLFAAPVTRVGRLLEDLRAHEIEPTAIDIEALALATVGIRALGRQGTSIVVDVSNQGTQAVLLSDGGLRSLCGLSAQGPGADLMGEVSSLLDRWAHANPTGVYLTGPDADAIDEREWSSALMLPVAELPFASVGVDAAAQDLTTWPSWAVPLGLALRGTDRRALSRVNLMSGPLGGAATVPPWRQTVAVLSAYGAILGALWGVAVWSEIAELDARRQSLERSIRQTFQEALPDVRTIVSEVDQLRTRVADLEERDRALSAVGEYQRSPLRTLRELSANIPRDLEVEIRDLLVDMDKLRIEGVTSSYRASERIKSQLLAASPRFAAATSEARDGSKPGEVLFTLSVNLAESK